MSVLTDADAVFAARKTLEIEETDDELPARYLAAFLEHVTARPNDTNFIIEFAEQRKGAGVGGNGFGITTCLEDYCWSDIRLGADPTLADGGKSTGFGSLWEYQNHCDLADHKKGREERCRKANKTYLSYDSSTAAPAAAVPAPASASGHASASATSQSTENRSGSAPSAPSASNRATPAPSRTPSSTSVVGVGASQSASAAGSMSMLDRLDAMNRSSPVASTSKSSQVTEIPAHRRLARTTSAASPSSADHRSGLSQTSVSTSAIPSSSNAAAGHSSSSSRNSTSLSNRPASLNSIPSAGTSSIQLDKKPSLSSLAALKPKPSSHSIGRTPPGSAHGTPSSSRAARGPTYVDVLSSDEEVVVLDRAPKHMQKQTNRDAPYLLSDSSDEDAQPAANGKGKGKQPLFRSGSGMGEGSVNIFEEMMSSSQPKVKKEKQIDGPTSAATSSAAASASAGAQSTTSDVKPNLSPASEEAIRDCRQIMRAEKGSLARLKTQKGKSYLATALARRTTELEAFEANPMMYGAYPHIPGALIQHDPSFKAISKWHEYKRQIVNFHARGVSITAAQLAQRPNAAPAAAPAALAAGDTARSQPMSAAERAALMRSVKAKESAILDRLFVSPSTRGAIFGSVAYRQQQLKYLDAAQPYPPVNQAIVNADRTGQYAVFAASSDYKLVIDAALTRFGTSSSVGNGAVAGPSGDSSSSSSATTTDVKPNLTRPEIGQTKIVDETRCARVHVLQQEKQTIAWLMGRGQDMTMRGLTSYRLTELNAASTTPTGNYPVIPKALIDADQTGQFKMISETLNYRLVTAWSSGEEAGALVAQMMGDVDTEGEMPGAFPRTGSTSTSNTAPFSLMGDITSAVNNLANSMPGGVFDPYAGRAAALAPLPGAAGMPPAIEAHMHDYDCPRDEHCLCHIRADADELYPRAGMMRQEDMATFLQDSFKDFSDDSTIDEALEKLGMPDMNAKFADMTVQLMPHQILGVNFMLQKEKDMTKKGGLLCDAMGLGKTVQTIATIAGHQSTDKKCKTTLIIAPLAVLSQWKSEIESKTAPGLFEVVIYHGTNKPKSKNVLKNADVVLTTYQTMANESGIDTRKKRGYGYASDDDSDAGRTKKGILFGVHWYRIVLDEAHFIRNRNTKASKAVDMLDSVYRWCLTGTLVNNSLTDVFPHLRFLHISPQREWTSFSQFVGRVEKKRPKLAAARVQAILKTCMMRRHKDSMLNGQRLLNLPPKTTEIVELDFTPEEREIYNAIESRMKVRFGQFLRQGTVLKHLSCVLTMLMRLRQLTCHPWLLRRNPGDPAHPHDFLITDDDIFRSLNIEPGDTAAELDRATQTLGQAWVDETSVRLSDRYNKMVDDTEDEGGVGECPICMEPFVDEIITHCRHSYCKTCINELFKAPPRDATDLSEEQVQQGVRNCPMCRGAIESKSSFAALAFFDPEKEAPAQGDEDGDVEMDVKPDVRKGKRKASANDDDDDDYKPDIKPDVKKGRGRAKPEPEDEDQEAAHLDPVEAVLPSTKMLKLKELLDTYLAEDGIKVIIFSEFVQYLKLVAVYLDSQGVKHGSYLGEMRQSDREDVVKRFNETKANSPRVLLISRKAGGAGLNLTVASKVISLDLAWNAAAENQAVDRAHRIGQTRPVEVQRLLIANTVEQRILDLQLKKEALSDGAMGEGTGTRVGRLTVNDLMRLFNYEDGHEDA